MNVTAVVELGKAKPLTAVEAKSGVNQLGRGWLKVLVELGSAEFAVAVFEKKLIGTLIVLTGPIDVRSKVSPLPFVKVMKGEVGEL